MYTKSCNKTNNIRLFKVIRIVVYDKYEWYHGNGAVGPADPVYFLAYSH